MKKVKIISIGGVAGTGKTTIARELTYRYGIYHRLGTGFLREAVKSMNGDKVLDCHTYRVSCENAYNHLRRQTDILKKPINACIDRAIKEGTSLILEGSHMIPWELECKKDIIPFVLYVSDRQYHLKLLNGKSHKNRSITEEQFQRIREMQESLIYLAQQEKVPLVDSGRNLKEVLYDVEKFLLKK